MQQREIERIANGEHKVDFCINFGLDHGCGPKVDQVDQYLGPRTE